MPIAFFLLCAALTKAEVVTEWAMTSSFEAIRMSVASGDFYAANAYRVSKKTRDTIEYRHPRGGPTREKLTFRGGSPLIIDVEASSPKVPLGERFLTLVRLEVRPKESGCDLRTRCRVVWRQPAGLLKRPIERAAEKGAVEAWRRWATWLDNKDKPKKKTVPWFLLTLVVLVVLQR